MFLMALPLIGPAMALTGLTGYALIILGIMFYIFKPMWQEQSQPHDKNASA